MGINLELLTEMVSVKENAFGLRLRQEREARGWSQAQLAERSGNVRSASFIAQVENNLYRKKDGAPMRPGLEVVDAWATALGIPISEFRDLAGHPQVAGEITSDEVLLEFTYSLEGYRALSAPLKSFARRHIRDMIDFLQLINQRYGDEIGDDPLSLQEERSVNIMREQDIPKLTSGQVKALAKKKKNKAT